MEDVPTPDSLAPGELVGPWRVERPAGRGTYGLVYLARNAGHPRSSPVALKLSVFPDDPRFAREAKLLSLIQHPAIPQLVDRGWWQPEGGLVHPYIVMQWVEGLPLYQWVELQNPSSRQVLLVLAQLAWALDALHEKNCLHRDVKGDNVRVAPDSRAFLIDYGSGTWAGAAPLTEGPMAPGTLNYRSPQALRFHRISHRQEGAHYVATPADDVYALGVAMYRTVTGIYPPPGTDPEAREEEPPPSPSRRPLPQALNPFVVPELAALIESMLAEEPRDRPDARELAEDAEAALVRSGPEADLPLSGPKPTPGQAARVPVLVRSKPQANPQERRPGLVAAAAVVLLGIGGLCVPDWQPHPPSEEVPPLAEAEAPDAGAARDGGTSSLGESTLASQSAFRGAPVSYEGISLELPEEPLPGQRRSPCTRSGEVEINGGCWKLLAGVTPPCDNDEYEWKGMCYVPVRKSTRSPTSKQP